MTEQQDRLAGPVAVAGLAGRARWLGQQHRCGAASPFGDVGHVYWDDGSARLLSALGITSATAAGNAPGRQRLSGAYCDALEGREPGDDGPGS